MTIKKVLVITAAEAREALLNWVVELYRNDPELLRENVETGDAWNLSEQRTTDEQVIDHYIEYSLGYDLAKTQSVDQIVIPRKRGIRRVGGRHEEDAEYIIVYDIEWEKPVETKLERELNELYKNDPEQRIV